MTGALPAAPAPSAAASRTGSDRGRAGRRGGRRRWSASASSPAVRRPAARRHRPSRRRRCRCRCMSLSALSEQSGTVAGIATHYVLAGLPNCSYPSPPANDLFVALSPSEYAGAAACGGYLTVTGPDGSVTVQVIDQCPECAAGHIDLSEPAFAEARAAGRGADQRPLPVPGRPAGARPDHDGGQVGLLAVLAGAAGRQHRQPARLGAGGDRLRRLAQPRAGQLQLLDRAVGRGLGPFTVRLTDTEGNQVTCSRPRPRRVQSTGGSCTGREPMRTASVSAKPGRPRRSPARRRPALPPPPPRAVAHQPRPAEAAPVADPIAPAS